MSSENLPRELPPPPTLEDRTVRRLRDEGLLDMPARVRSPRRTWRRLAAAVVVFAAGAASGMWVSGRDASVPQPRFLLLLHGASTAAGDEEQTAVAAYREWAVALRNQGRYVAGERLGAQAAVVPEGGDTADAVQGYFVVSATSLDDAAVVAASMPHVARGGRVVVRPIDTP
jgi:hypothetical protein